MGGNLWNYGTMELWTNGGWIFDSLEDSLKAASKIKKLLTGGEVDKQPHPVANPRGGEPSSHRLGGQRCHGSGPRCLFTLKSLFFQCNVACHHSVKS